MNVNEEFYRTFKTVEQEDFAKLSGDYNPIHTDPMAARRTKFGEVVVHGIHSLLWGLEVLLSKQSGVCALGKLESKFPNFVGLDKQSKLTLSEEASNIFIGEVVQGASTCLSFKVEIVSQGNEQGPQVVFDRQQLQSPDILTPNDFSCNSDKPASLFLYSDRQLARMMFPNLSAKLPEWQLAFLLTVSRLVGMKCPGLYSILAGIDLNMSVCGSKSSKLNYKIDKWDPRFSMLVLDIGSTGVSGKVNTFVRPPLVQQPSCEELGELLIPGEFSGQNFLIVGGSRGLGEVTAKLAAVGGGRVCITYSKDMQGAERVCREIQHVGGIAESVSLDVTAGEEAISEMLHNVFAPNQVYYYATPSIFNTQRGVFEANILLNFLNYYLIGFQKLILKLRNIFPGRDLKVFYPSSVAVDEVPLDMGEYAAAKSAGEVFCEFAKKVGYVKAVRCPRLPRLDTDQTVSLLPVNNQPPAPLILEEMRMLSIA